MSLAGQSEAQSANPLEQLRQLSTVVADTGDIDSVARLRPTDATTNPSLVLAAAANPAYLALIEAARQVATRDGAGAAVESLIVEFGRRILEHVPRWVSTEVDARLSFDTAATVAQARRLIARYEAGGTSRERVLIKIAATWEGIRAASVLEAEGIRCNLTLIFSAVQAAACADAGVTLISPFVGRILDWHKARDPDADFSGDQDPGVRSVRGIAAHYRQRGAATLVMGASFRNTDQIRALAGCDLLTISPALLDELAAQTAALSRAIDAADTPLPALPAWISEAAFRYQLNEDAMASDRLADGIRRFATDQAKLEALLSA